VVHEAVLLEPAGGALPVAAPVTRAVEEVLVREGDVVTKGQPLVRLDAAVERAQLRVATSRVAVAAKNAELSADAAARNAGLSAQGQISPYEYRQSQLRAEADRAALAVATSEAALARAQLERLTLVAPADGVVYKLDLRPGETLVAGDDSRIICGPRRLGVRSYVESYWIGRVKPGLKYDIRDAETGERLGTGVVTAVSPYVGGREFRTEDPNNRHDAKFQEVVIEMVGDHKPMPIGLRVVTELK